MKTEKWITAFWAALLAFLAALGGVGCLITGFDIAVPEQGWVVLACGIGAGVFSICCVHRVGWFPGGVLALLGGYLWQKGPLAVAAEGLVFHISFLYDLGYGWGAVRWSSLDPTQADPTLALCLLGVLVTAAVAWTVSGKHTAWVGVCAAAIPFGACLVLTNTVPDTLYLGLFFVAVCLLLLTQPVRRKQLRKGNTLTAMTVIPVVAAVVIMLYLCPQQTYTGQRGADRIETFVMDLLGLEKQEQILSSTPGNHSEDKVSLSAVGQKTYQSNKVMHLQSDQSGQLYLRGCAYDIYDGTNWIRSEGPWSLDGEYAVSGASWEISITTMRPHDVVYMPQVVPRMLGSMDRGRVDNKDGDTRHYYVCTDLVTYNESWDVQGGSISAQTAQQYLQLPEETAQWARAYLAEALGAAAVGNSAGDIWRYARQVADLVQSSAAYDLQTRRMPAEQTDFARWFLENSDTGYCVHFATTTAVLLRSVGIPARYVTGYLVNAEAKENVSVRLRDAHAWVEIYLANVGWVVLEATPGGFGSPVPEQTQPVEIQPTQTQPEQTETTETTVPTTEETTTVTEPSTEVTRPPVTSPVGGADTPEIPQKQNGGNWLTAVLPVIAVVFGIIGQWQLRLWLRRKKQHTGAANAQALARWQEVQIHAKLRREMPEELLVLAQKARFSQHTLTRQELHAFDRYLIQSRKVLKRYPLWHRLYHTLILAIY